MAKQTKLEFYRDKLVIHQDELDDCVSQHPELFYHVADHHALAVAERDAVKLSLEEAEASYAQELREAAVTHNVKITEGNIQERLAVSAPLSDLRTELSAAKLEVDRWAALRDAYSQRGYALRDLVPLYLSRLGTGSIAANTRQQMVDAIAPTRNLKRRDG